VTFTKPDAAVPPEVLNVAVHPTQLLEAGGELAIFLLIHLHFLRRRIAGELAPGVTALVRLAMYGVLRFSVDFLRGDDPDFRWGWITVSQGICLAVIGLTVWYSCRVMRSFRPAATSR
jgi:prolipoprotein diacylglyceryltransferase